MRKLRIFEHVSLEGVIQVSGGPGEGDFPYGDWTAPYRSPGGLAMLLEKYGERFDLLLGRRTCDAWSGFWPKAPKGPMADLLNAATKYVVTHRPESLEWPAAVGRRAERLPTRSTSASRSCTTAGLATRPEAASRLPSPRFFRKGRLLRQRDEAVHRIGSGSPEVAEGDRIRFGRVRFRVEPA